MQRISLAELIVCESVRQVKARYTYLLDTKQWPAWRNLFTDDFHWESTEVEGHMTVDGADRFVDMVASSLGELPTVHHVHNPVLEVTSSTTATAIWPMFDYVKLSEQLGSGLLQGFGHYHETYRLDRAGDWKISTMVLTRLRVDDISALSGHVGSAFGAITSVTTATAAMRTRV